MRLPSPKLLAACLVAVTVAACASDQPGTPVRTYSGGEVDLAAACRSVAADGDQIAMLITAQGIAVQGDVLLSPVSDAPVSSHFGPRWGRFHAGVDFDADYGAPVVAAQRGTVMFAGRRSGYGRLVEIRHANGDLTRYAHLSQFTDDLEEGLQVEAGEQIGNVGASGRVTGAHLHFELHINDEAVDPVEYLGRPLGCREIWVSARPEARPE